MVTINKNWLYCLLPYNLVTAVFNAVRLVSFNFLFIIELELALFCFISATCLTKIHIKFIFCQKCASCAAQKALEATHACFCVSESHSWSSTIFQWKWRWCKWKISKAVWWKRKNLEILICRFFASLMFAFANCNHLFFI